MSTRNRTLSAVLATLVTVSCAGATTAGTSASRAPSIEIGAFTLTNDRDPLTNRASPGASTFDDEHNGMLQFACLADGLAVLVGVSGDVAKTANTLTVRAAFDSAPPTAESVWLVQRQNGFTLAYLRPDEIPAFTASALTAAEARVRVANSFNNSVGVYRFSLKGLADARGRLPCWEAD